MKKGCGAAGQNSGRANIEQKYMTNVTIQCAVHTAVCMKDPHSGSARDFMHEARAAYIYSSHVHVHDRRCMAMHG